MMSVRRRMLPLVPLSVALAVLLAGCSAQPERSAPYTGDVPAFSGAWAAEFAQEHRDAPDERIRAILEDGVVSDAEYAEVEALYRACTAERGVRVGDIRFDGSAEFGWDSSITVNQANEYETACSISSGEASVGRLWHGMRRNPDLRDEEELMLGCLKSAGVVDAAMTLERWQGLSYEDKRAESETTAEEVAIVDACRLDPLGLNS